jgi:hypothetical protein
MRACCRHKLANNWGTSAPLPLFNLRAAARTPVKARKDTTMFFGVGFFGGIADIVLAVGAFFAYQRLRAIWDSHPELSQNKRLRDIPFIVAGFALLLCTSPQWVWLLPWEFARLFVFGVWAALGLNGLYHIRLIYLKIKGAASDDSTPK